MKPGRVSYLLLGLLQCACKDPEYRLVHLDQKIVDSIGYLRAVSAPPAAVEATRLYRLSLPDSVTRFDLGLPSATDIAGAPACLLLAADRADRAIHEFRTDGAYVGSAYGGGRDTSYLREIVSIASSTGGRILVSRLGGGRVLALNRRGQVEQSFPLPLISDRLTDVSQIAVSGHGVVAEHWLGTRMPTHISGAESKPMPLVRIFGTDGTLLLSAGHAFPFPGKSLFTALNHGIVAVSDDSVWFARTADARILGMPLPSGIVPGITDFTVTIDLPLYFMARLPGEYVFRDGSTELPDVNQHVTGFDVSPDNRYFVMGRTLRYPDPADTAKLYRPETTLSVWDRRRGITRLVNLTGEIMSVSTTGELIVVQLYLQPEEKRVVEVLANPLWTGPLSCPTGSPSSLRP